jgi:outer membrane protein OmpA-like peptidoglycan-associated protein
MRFAANILTPVMAFCLIESGSNRATRQEHFVQPIVEKATAESAVADTAFFAVRRNEQTEDPRLTQVSTPSEHAQSSSEALQEPIFLKQPLLFTPNGLNLTASSRHTLNCAAAWLYEHHEARILIVGYCDDSGSEACSTALAERRAEVVRRFLLSLGTQADQIAGVKGWENQAGSCHAGATECQRQNRSARLFVAEPAGRLK